MLILVVSPKERHKDVYTTIIEWYKAQNADNAFAYAPGFSFCQTEPAARDLLIKHTFDLVIADDFDDDSERDNITLYRFLREDPVATRLKPELKKTSFVFFTGRKSVWIFWKRAHDEDDNVFIFGSREGIPFRITPDMDYATFKSQLP